MNETKCCQAEEAYRPMESIPVEPDGAQRIYIEPLDYGYTVRIGCQSFAIEETDALMEYLTRYLKNPAKYRDLWMRSKTLPNSTLE